MYCWLNLLFWLAFTGAFAYGQGLLMPRLKQVSEGTPEAKRHDFALHGLFVVVWLLPVLPWALVLPWWQVVVTAGLVRFCCFDIALNQAEGTPLFSVGGTADTDKLLRKIGLLIGIPAAYLSAVFRALAFLLLCGFLWMFCG